MARFNGRNRGRNRIGPWTHVWSGAFLVFCVGGCVVPEKPKVYIDASRIRAELSKGVPALDGLNKDWPSRTVTLSGERGRNLFLGLTEADLKKSLAGIGQQQRQTIDRIFAQRQRVLEAEVESALASARTRLQPQHQVILDDAVAQTRIPFDKYAPRIGAATLELTNLIGFPDRGQTYPEVDAAWSRQRAERVKELREAIASWNGAYQQERDAIMNQALARIQRDLDALDRNAKVALAEGKARLTESLQQLAREGESQAPDPQMNVDTFVVPPSATKSQTFPAAQERLTGLPATESQLEPEWKSAETVKIWLTLHGYERVASPREGRNATDEVVRWIRSRRVGP